MCTILGAVRGNFQMHIKTNNGYHTEFYKDFQGDFIVFFLIE